MAGSPVSVTKLRLKLMEFGAPQYMVAARAGMSPSRISEYALGKRPMQPHHVVALCNLFRCNPEDIMGEADVTLDGLEVGIL